MQRNGQNPIRKAAMYNSGSKTNKNELGKTDNASGGASCRLCGAKIEPKPGFRVSKLKCKCGGSAA